MASPKTREAPTNSIGGGVVTKMLVDGQRTTIRQDLELELATRNLAYTKAAEIIKQDKMDAEALTNDHFVAIRTDQVKKQLELDLLMIDNSLKTTVARSDVGVAEAKSHIAVEVLELEQRRSVDLSEVEMRRLELENRLVELRAEVSAVVAKAGAVSPQLIAALSSFSEHESLERVAEAMAPLAILRNSGIKEVLGKLLAGTPLAKHLLSNGAAAADGAAPAASADGAAPAASAD